jgi:hypothetical protein
MGFGQEHLRMPLTPMEDANKQKLLSLMRAAGIALK